MLAGPPVLIGGGEERTRSAWKAIGDVLVDVWWAGGLTGGWRRVEMVGGEQGLA